MIVKKNSDPEYINYELQKGTVMVIPKSSKLAQLEAEAHDGTRLILSNISLDNLIPTFKKIKKQYPEIVKQR